MSGERSAGEWAQIIVTAYKSDTRPPLTEHLCAEGVAKLLRTKRPSVLVGVPTLYEALSRDLTLKAADLSCLRACFCGADTLPRPVKERFEKLVKDRGGTVRLLEGYGLTEAVSAIMATPLNEYREGSIGVPFPDTKERLAILGEHFEIISRMTRRDEPPVTLDGTHARVENAAKILTP